MNALAAKAIDRVVIRFAALAASRESRIDSHPREAHELLSQAGFFTEFPETPPELRFLSQNEFQFSSRISTPWDENDLVRGKLFRCHGQWQAQPTVILL